MAEFESMRISSTARRSAMVSEEGSRLTRALNVRMHVLEMNNQVGHYLGSYKCRDRDYKNLSLEREAATKVISCLLFS